MASPPKPWERAGAGASSASGELLTFVILLHSMALS